MRLRPPRSLRARLLAFLLFAIVATAAAQGVTAYRTALAEADQIFDFHMQVMAQSLRGALRGHGTGLENHGPEGGQGADFIVQVWSAEGRKVFESGPRGPLPERAAPGFSDVRMRGTTYRVFALGSHAQVIQVAQDMAARREMAGALALRMVAPIAIMAPLLMLVVWWVVSASLAPVSRVRRQLAERQADGLHEVGENGLPEEVLPLVRELNQLFRRLRVAFDAQQNFVADAAHELRSPLAALKLQAQGLARARDHAARDVAVARLTAGIDRATRLVEQLLELTRQQAQAAAATAPQRLALASPVRLALADAAPAAQARSIDLGLGHADGGEIAGHPEALRILLGNLLDNALKHTPEGGTVDVELRATTDAMMLSVEDSGPGIPARDRERVFDRFFRGPDRKTAGSGLGLAIVKSIADLHGATLALGPSPRLGGLRVEVRFRSEAAPVMTPPRS